MGWNGKRGASTHLLLYRLHNVVRHKGFAIVFADVAIGHEAGFTAQVAGELAAEVVRVRPQGQSGNDVPTRGRGDGV